KFFQQTLTFKAQSIPMSFHFGTFSVFMVLSLTTMQAQTPPTCEQQAHELTIHGDTRIDKYYWLNDYWLEGPQKEKVVDYLNAENAYQEAVMAPTKDLQESLYNEMIARIKQT